MSLHEYPDIIQGSEEWHDARRGVVTASAVGKLITPKVRVADNEVSRGITATLAAERITGWTEESHMTPDMWRGVLHEPIARNHYADKRGIEVRELGFMVRDDWGWQLGYSPDGLVGDDGLVEIKCPRAKTHLGTILADQVPDYYMAQLQCGLLVSGRAWIDFVSFVGGMPLFIKRVYPSPNWFAVIEEAGYKFEANAARLIADYETATNGLEPTERIDHNELGLVF